MILEKTPITQEVLPEMLKNSTQMLEMRNDIYSTYQLQPPPHLNGEKPSCRVPGYLPVPSRLDSGSVSGPNRRCL